MNPYLTAINELEIAIEHLGIASVALEGPYLLQEDIGVASRRINQITLPTVIRELEQSVAWLNGEANAGSPPTTKPGPHSHQLR